MEEREGCRVQGGSRREGGKEEGASEITRVPLFYYYYYFLVPSWLIIDIASLIRNLHSKPKSII